MPTVIKYSSIDQFRKVIRDISHKARFVGVDNNGKAIYDSLLPLPVIEVVGSEKIHGSNAAVGYSESLGFWVQSRKQILTPEKDHGGCASLVYKNKEIWMNFIQDLSKKYNIDLKKELIIIYFELAGQNIQKKSACATLETRAIIFQNFRSMNVSDIGKENYPSSWHPTKIDTNWISSPKDLIFNIMNFPTYKIKIDFNNPEKSQNEMIDKMLEVEKNSPVGKQMGVDGNIGEGLVFEFIYKGERFAWKVKGEKHSKTRIKKLNPIDLEKLNKIEQLVENITHNWRFEQALQEVFGKDYETNISRKNLGPYLKWVAKDTLKEEMDLIQESGLEVKDIMKKVSQKAREYFFKVEQEKTLDQK